MNTRQPTYKYWFWSGAALLVISFFLPAYHETSFAFDAGVLVGASLWVAVIVFDNDAIVVAGTAIFFFSMLNLVQILCATVPKIMRMSGRTLPYVFLFVGFALLPAFFMYDMFQEVHIPFGTFTGVDNTVRIGAVLYLVSFIPSGIGIILRHKLTKAEERVVEEV